VAINRTFYNWQTHLPAPDANYNYCSPNINQIADELGKRWGMTNLGCYGWRAVRAGTAPSSHGFGAATDRRYDEIGRYRAVTEVIPWLIDNSLELHVSAFHDYIGCRIWRAGRTSSLADAHTKWWLTQAVNPLNGMGQSWAIYFHIETTQAGWMDGTPIPNRTMVVPEPIPDPDPPPITPLPGGTFVHQTIKLGDTNADVYAFQMFAKKYAGNTDILIDGKFGPITHDAALRVQAWYNLGVDGVIGPKSWAQIDLVANSS